MKIANVQINPWLFIAGVIIMLAIFTSAAVAGEIWKITAYCSCYKCCGKTDGIMASGKKVYPGAVACNWLPFGTKVKIQGLGTFVVEDRGAKSLFGSRNNHIKHLDIWMANHSQARRFGVKFLEVEVLSE